MYLDTLKVGIQTESFNESTSQTNLNTLLNELAYWKQQYQEMRAHRDQIKEELVQLNQLYQGNDSSLEKDRQIEELKKIIFEQRGSQTLEFQIREKMQEQQNIIQELRNRLDIQQELEIRFSKLEQNDLIIKEQEDKLNTLMYRIWERDERIKQLEEQNRRIQIKQCQYYEEQLYQLKKQVIGVNGEELRVQLERQILINNELQEKHERLICYVTDLESELNIMKSQRSGIKEKWSDNKKVIQYKVVSSDLNEEKLVEMFKSMHPNESQIKIQRL